MQRLAVPAALLVMIAGAATMVWFECRSLSADEKPPAKKEPELLPLKAFMRAKLAASEQILDGIATEDFVKIEGGAIRMQIMTKASEWKVSDSQMYLDQSEEFRKILGRLKDQAKKKNLDGAAITYVEMTMSCVRCHQELRKTPPAEKSRE